MKEVNQHYEYWTLESLKTKKEVEMVFSRRNLKRIAIPLLLCLSLVVSTLAGCAPAVEVEKTPIKIGMAADFSKVQAPYSVQRRLALEMYINEVNQEGGIDGHPIELIVVDSELDTAKATAAAERLITVEKVLALFGPTSSSEALAMKVVVEREGVPFFAGITSAVPVSQPVSEAKWTFRFFIPNNVFAAEDADMLVKLGKRIGISHSSTAYGVDGRDEIIRALEKLGVEPVVVEAVEPGVTDLTAHVLRFKEAGVDVIMSWNLTGDAAVLLKSIALLGWGGVVVSNCQCSPAFQAIAGTVLTTHYSCAMLHPENPVAQEALRLWEDTYGKPASTEEETLPATCDEARCFLNALSKAKLTFDPAKLSEDRAKLRDAIEATDMLAMGGKPGKTMTFSPTDHDVIEHGHAFFKVSSDSVHWELLQL